MIKFCWTGKFLQIEL